MEGSERTEIPEQVIRKLLEQCAIYGINPKLEHKKMTYMRVREFLKATRYSGFFENIPKIIGILTGIPPNVFTKKQKEQLNTIFHEVQKPFKKNKGKRKNFPSYAYITYKFCELMGYNEFLPLLHLLAPKNLMVADSIWEHICSECKYQYIPTIPHYY